MHAPGAEHLVLYHLVIEGGAVVELLDGQCIELRPGDVVIFPHGDPHHMSSGKGAVRPFPNYGISAKINSRDLTPLRAGGGGHTSRFVCGSISAQITPDTGWRVPSSTWWKKQPPDGSAAKLCSPNYRRHYSSTPCGAT